MSEPSDWTDADRARWDERLLHEHDVTPLPRWPLLERSERGDEMPAGWPAPALMCSLRAVVGP